MAGMIPQDVVEDVRVANDIADVIGSYITLKRGGSRMLALCPFHKEKTPSFHVNRDRQSFHCFGCGAGGDVFRFVMQYENVDFPTSIRILAQRAGIVLRVEENSDAGGGPSKDVLYRLHTDLTEALHKWLLEADAAAAARRYLAERDLGAEIVRDFKLGYAPDRGAGIQDWARRNGHADDLMEAAGVLARSEDGRLYDRFRGRLMFPIWDEQGRVIAFSGRIMDAAARTAKYVNSPETTLFRKGRVLYALHKARRPIAEARVAVLCEGQIDVIRCHAAGVNNAVAAQGTAFTENHARAIARLADEAVIVFDSDRAGQEAAVRTGQILLEAGIAVRVAGLAAGEDPDSFIRKSGAEPFRECLGAAQSLVDFQLDVLSAHEEVGSQAGVVRMTRAVVETLQRCPNVVLRERLVTVAAQRLQVAPAAILQELGRAVRRRPAANEEDSAAPARRPEAPRVEKDLVRHLVHVADGTLVDLVHDFLPLRHLWDDACRQLVACCIEARQTGATLRQCVQAHEPEPGDLTGLLAEIENSPMPLGREFTAHEAVRDQILFLRQRELKRERDAIDARGAAQGGGADPALRKRSLQIRHDLHLLQKWDSALSLLHEPSQP